MEEFVSPSLTHAVPHRIIATSPRDGVESGRPRVTAAVRDTGVIAEAAWHALAWLAISNIVGAVLAVLLVLPRLNRLLEPFTYGRWMPVHIDLQLYGWCSLPLVAFLLRVYQADLGNLARWSRAALWMWSAALLCGVVSWLTGHTTGKLFLDWTGYLRVLFPLALLGLWCVLAASYLRQLHSRHTAAPGPHIVRGVGLIALLFVPVALFCASNPTVYPPINPDTGGPTGASQLESVLIILLILLLLPFGISERNQTSRTWVRVAWVVFVLEALLCLSLGRADVSHHRPTQFISLGSLLVWLPLTPAYYSAFTWHEQTRRWRNAMLVWWSVLVPTGWSLFLPGVLDHLKFTDGLVAHSLLAMAGFSSSLLLFLLVQLLGDEGWTLNTRWPFWLWNACVAAYVIVMFAAGWREGSDPSFALLPGKLRNGLYLVRFALGLGMLAASLDWLYWVTGIQHSSGDARQEATR
jgi:cytochrome c oxidase cbb3-type subunit 1